MKRTIATLALTAGIALSGGTLAGGQVPIPQPAAITDYANYPANSQTAPGCDGSDVHGAEYTINGGAPVFDLRNLPPIHAGDVLEVSWTDVSPECDTPDFLQPISVALKASVSDTFNPGENQYLRLPYAFTTMGPMGGRITYVLPSLTGDDLQGCFAQIDFIVGLPLAVVGPDGSYYSLNGVKNTLVSAWNGEYDQCDDVPEETTTTTQPEETTTTTAPEAPTTTQPEAPTTTFNETATTLTVTTAAVTIVEASAASAGQIATQVAAAHTVASMPVTGMSPILLLVGAGLVILGLVVAILTTKPPRTYTED